MKKRSATGTNRLSRLQLNFATSGKKGKRRHIKVCEEGEENSPSIEQDNNKQRDECSILLGSQLQDLLRMASQGTSSITPYQTQSEYLSKDGPSQVVEEKQVEEEDEEDEEEDTNDHYLLSCAELKEKIIDLLNLPDRVVTSHHHNKNSNNQEVKDQQAKRQTERQVERQTERQAENKMVAFRQKEKEKQKLSIKLNKQKKLMIKNSMDKPANEPITTNTVINSSLQSESTIFLKRPLMQPFKAKRVITVHQKDALSTKAINNSANSVNSINRNTHSLINQQNESYTSQSARQQNGSSVTQLSRQSGNLATLPIRKPSSKASITDCLIDRKKNLIMAFTPRATCTLAVSMFIHHMGLYGQAKEMSDWIHHYRGNVLEKKPQYIATNKDWENPNMVRFKIVRNPYHRAVSSYTHFIRSSSSNQSFEEYLTSLLEGSSNNLSTHEVTVRDYHSKPQHNQWDGLVNHIVKIEEIDKELKVLDYRYKTSLHDSYLAVKGKDSHIMIKDKSIQEYVGKKDGDFYRLPDREFRIPDYPHFYNETSRDLVEQLYGDDIRYFNYEWPFTGGT